MVEEAVKRYMATHPAADADACASAFRAHRPGLSREEATAIYDTWAAEGMYEKDLCAERYQGPKYASEGVGELVSTDRDRALILDVACGTGLVAEWLQKWGFKRFHGLDPSPGMLDLARQKNIYEKLTCGYLDANPLPFDTATFDVAVISGGIGCNQIPPEGLRQLVRVIKPEGFVCIATRGRYAKEASDYRDRIDEEMKMMEREGMWRLLSASIVSKYSFDNDGIVYKYVVC